MLHLSAEQCWRVGYTLDCADNGREFPLDHHACFQLQGRVRPLPSSVSVARRSQRLSRFPSRRFATFSPSSGRMSQATLPRGCSTYSTQTAVARSTALSSGDCCSISAALSSGLGVALLRSLLKSPLRYQALLLQPPLSSTTASISATLTSLTRRLRRFRARASALRHPHAALWLRTP